MSLAQFIAKSSKRIADEWVKFAATCMPAASSMNLNERRDHIEAILRRITEDLAQPQTSRQQAEKAKGNADAEPSEETGAKSHGSARAESGYSPDQMFSEFRALRACVLRLWLEEQDRFDRAAFDEITRFDEAVDQALAESVLSFSADVEKAKDLFLGVLGHDLRTPLAAVMIGATLMMTREAADWAHAKTAARILRSGTRMDEIIRDLLDFTRGRLGGGIPVSRHEMDLDALLRQCVDELGGAHHRCPITLASPGPSIGSWDRARLGQVLTNLIVNACQHGVEGAPIEVTLGGDDASASVAIHNQGKMIAPSHLNTIFEPFRRLGANRATDAASSSIGLGLYIAKTIVAGHHGTIAVASTTGGTTFTVRLPRHA
jgi:signal transduction histidine kinase